MTVSRLLVCCAIALLPAAAFAQSKLAIDTTSFTIGPGEEKYITVKEIGKGDAQPALFGGSCIDPGGYLRVVNSTYRDPEKRVLETHVRRTRTPVKASGKCNVIFALRGKHGFTDQTTVRVTVR